jgi:hypothetical protein
MDQTRELEILVQAKELIEKCGKNDYVLEMSQPCVMGGETLTLTSRTELDKGYIGYRGFMDYQSLCQEIVRMNKNANQH